MDDQTVSGKEPADGGEAAYADLWSRPGFLIRRLHQLHAALFVEECGAHEVTPVQYAVLSVLYRGRALDQISVAGEVGIDRTNAADVIRRLERRGHVERIANPGDRRKRLARITPGGRRFVEDAHDAMERAQRRLLAVGGRYFAPKGARIRRRLAQQNRRRLRPVLRGRIRLRRLNGERVRISVVVV